LSKTRIESDPTSKTRKSNMPHETLCGPDQ